MSLAYEDANFKLVDVVTVADDDVEKRVDEFGSDLEAEVKFMLRL